MNANVAKFIEVALSMFRKDPIPADQSGQVTWITPKQCRYLFVLAKKAKLDPAGANNYNGSYHVDGLAFTIFTTGSRPAVYVKKIN